MNILIEPMPETIEIGTKMYGVNFDFRSCLRIILAFESEELTDSEKQYVLITNLYKNVPDDVEAAVKRGVEFLNGGESESEENGGDQFRLYSFDKDARFITAAFQQTHGIDITKADMHWWRFLALFMDLGSDTVFNNLVNLRRRVKTGKATKEEREAARDMGDLFNLPEFDTRSFEEKEMEASFLRALKQ